MYASEIKEPEKVEFLKQFGGSVVRDSRANPFTGTPYELSRWMASGKRVAEIASWVLPYSVRYPHVMAAMVSFGELGRGHIDEKIALVQQIRRKLDSTPATVAAPLDHAYLTGIVDSSSYAYYNRDGSNWTMSIYLPSEALAQAVKATVGGGNVAPASEHSVMVNGEPMLFAGKGYRWLGYGTLAYALCRAVHERSLFRRYITEHILMNPRLPIASEGS